MDLANRNVEVVEANDLLARSDTSDEEEGDEVIQQQAVSIEEARACIEKLETFASSNELTTFLTGVVDGSTQLTDFTINACTEQRKTTTFCK